MLVCFLDCVWLPRASSKWFSRDGSGLIFGLRSQLRPSTLGSDSYGRYASIDSVFCASSCITFINLVITITFERRASAKLSSWLKKVRDSGEHPNWMPHVFDELGLYWNTDKFKAMSEKAKKARGSLKVARCTPDVQRSLKQLQERWKKNWDTLPWDRRFPRRLMSGRKKMSRIWMCGWRKGPNELL
ncbi:hypothetical protein RDI58_028541 [Solanum bulbocastanum]|uniref:Uncharacterized protein n=1 Tax=Solanum bulbocastanum TaxID=147425 RepID=A0AAN8SVQ9_SOLBU